MRALLLLLPLLFSGCVAPVCDAVPVAVRWDEPMLAFDLHQFRPEGWDVTVHPAGDGFPGVLLGRWNASVVDVAQDLEGASVVYATPGALHLLTDPDDPSDARGAVRRFLANVTDGDEAERVAWTEALLAAPPEVDPMDPHVRPLRTTPVPGERFDLSAVLDRFPDPPPSGLVYGDDGLHLGLDFPSLALEQGLDRFHLSHHENVYTNLGWDGVDEATAREDFGAAYRRLGNPVPHGDVVLGC